MAAFIVIVKESHHAYYRVEASSEAEARERVFSSYAQFLRTEFEDTLADDSSNIVDGRYTVKTEKEI